MRVYYAHIHLMQISKYRITCVQICTHVSKYVHMCKAAMSVGVGKENKIDTRYSRSLMKNVIIKLRSLKWLAAQCKALSFFTPSSLLFDAFLWFSDHLERSFVVHRVRPHPPLHHFTKGYQRNHKGQTNKKRLEPQHHRAFYVWATITQFI
eukprot:GHVS01001122.1.p1 GENE.GHVS01001122.1~~GHVS01001122.1.p1  ORF type:complete len:151 (+),score=5.15 GHVS01001122.1:639-1091(+)